MRDDSSSEETPFQFTQKRGGSSSQTPLSPSQNLTSSSQQSQDPGQLKKQAERRQAKKEFAAKKAKEVDDGLAPIYAKKSETKQLLADCEAKEHHTVAKIFEMLEDAKPTFEDTVASYNKAIQMAQTSIAEHKDKKLSASAAKRVQLCNDIVSNIKAKLQSIKQQNNSAEEMALSYMSMVKNGVEVPFQAAQEMETLLRRTLLEDRIKKMLRELIKAINEHERKAAYASIKTLPKGDSRGEAELLNRHGCFKRPDGGTSDVRLLQNEDGTIAHAFKSVAGESAGGLDRLNLPKGASSMREDVSSTICESLKTATGGKLNLGFPVARVVKLDGQVGALIEGVKGEMADAEEINSMADYERKHGAAKAKEKTEKIKKNCRELPDKITADSLENVVLSTVFTCQWDCKWGNMIVDDNGDAKPIDGGTAVPTKDVVRDFRDGASGSPTPSALLCYPQHHPRAGETMDQAKQKMTPKKVEAIVKLNAAKLMDPAKDRRDQLVQENAGEFNNGLMKDECFDIVQASIQGAQQILLDKPDITLEEFVEAYQEWFKAWAKTVGD